MFYIKSLKSKINRYDERTSEILYLINEEKQPKEQFEPEMRDLENVWNIFFFSYIFRNLNKLKRKLQNIDFL